MSADWDGLAWVHAPERSSDREKVFVLARHGEVLENEGRPVVQWELVPGWKPRTVPVPAPAAPTTPSWARPWVLIGGAAATVAATVAATLLLA